MPDTIGTGIVAESNLREIGDDESATVGADVAAMMQRVASVASNGYVRNRLTVLHGGKRNAAATARGGIAETEMPLFAGALAVSVETMEIAALMPDSRADKIREARMKGYQGDSCGECGNFTLVRNGTCLKCDTCGATSGCS